MADVITVNGGGTAILSELRDFTELVEEHISFEAARWLEGYLSDAYGEEGEIDAVIDEYEKDMEKQKGRYRQVMEEIRAEAEMLSGLIREKDLDRKAISNAAGRIGSLTWREVNRP